MNETKQDFTDKGLLSRLQDGLLRGKQGQVRAGTRVQEGPRITGTDTRTAVAVEKPSHLPGTWGSNEAYSRPPQPSRGPASHRGGQGFVRVSPGCPCPPAGPALLGARPQPLAQMHVGCPRGWAGREQRLREMVTWGSRGLMGEAGHSKLSGGPQTSSLGRRVEAEAGGGGQTQALRGPGEMACGGDPSTEKRVEMPQVPPESPRQTAPLRRGQGGPSWMLSLGF